MKRLSTKQITMVSVLASLLVVVSRIGGFPILGGQGSIRFTAILYPIIGIVLGPYLGFMTSLLGNIIAWVLPPSTMLGLLMVIPGAIASFLSGILASGKRWPNWKAGAMLLASVNLLWYITPLGVEAPLYPVAHWFALAAIVFFRDKLAEYTRLGETRRLTLGVAVISFIATMAEHMAGNLVFISALGLVVPLRLIRDAIRSLGIIQVSLGVPTMESIGLGGLFMAVLPISILERAIITAGSTLIGMAILRALGSIRIFQPRQESERNI